MAEIVEAHRRQPSATEQRVEGCAQESGRTDGRADLVGEDKIICLPGGAELEPLLRLTNTVEAERGHRGKGERHLALGVRGLRRCHYQLASNALERAANL